MIKRLIFIVIIIFSICSCATGIHKAVINRDYREVKKLIENGTDINSVDQWGNTPLILAASYGNLPIVEYLRQQGADVNMQNQDGRTALLEAVYHNRNLDIIKILLYPDANTKLKDKFGYDAFLYAKEKGRKDIIYLLKIQSGEPVTDVLSARLYSEDGKIFSANFSENENGQGFVWGELKGGEKFKGEYFTVIKEKFNSSFLTTPWGQIRLESSNAESLITHITAVGDKGTQIRCVSLPHGNHGVGSCIDSNKNSYQLHY